MSLYEAIWAAKEHKIKFTGSTVTLKVEGLKDAVEVDPFEGLDVPSAAYLPQEELLILIMATILHIEKKTCTQTYSLYGEDAQRHSSVQGFSVRLKCFSLRPSLNKPLSLPHGRYRERSSPR